MIFFKLVDDYFYNLVRLAVLAVSFFGIFKVEKEL